MSSDFDKVREALDEARTVGDMQDIIEGTETRTGVYQELLSYLEGCAFDETNKPRGPNVNKRISGRAPDSDYVQSSESDDDAPSTSTEHAARDIARTTAKRRRKNAQAPAAAVAPEPAFDALAQSQQAFADGATIPKLHTMAYFDARLRMLLVHKIQGVASDFAPADYRTKLACMLKVLEGAFGQDMAQAQHALATFFRDISEPLTELAGCCPGDVPPAFAA